MKEEKYQGLSTEEVKKLKKEEKENISKKKNLN